ncbi:MAG: hypothetical protein ABSF38_18100 [Verrucomicrobiota bacterium]|jgi:hypothetical protein
MLLIPWKRLIFFPPFLFQISHDVQPLRRGNLVTPIRQVQIKPLRQGLKPILNDFKPEREWLGEQSYGFGSFVHHSCFKSAIMSRHTPQPRF